MTISTKDALEAVAEAYGVMPDQIRAATRNRNAQHARRTMAWLLSALNGWDQSKIATVMGTDQPRVCRMLKTCDHIWEGRDSHDRRLMSAALDELQLLGVA